MFSKIKALSIKCPSKLVRISALALLINPSPFSPMSFAGEVVERTMAIVNNEPILMSDLKALEGKMGKEMMVDETLIPEGDPSSLKKDLNRQIQYLINEKILDSEVKRHNLSVTMARVDQEINDIAKRNHVSKDTLLKSIGQQGLTLAEYQNFMKTRIERQSLIEQEVTSKIRLTDDDLLAFYSNENGKSAVKIFEFGISQIFFPVEKKTPAEVLKKANQTLSALRSGGNFEKTSAQLNEESGLELNGVLGTFRSGEFAPEMEKAVRNLNVGDVSEVVKGRTGYHILKLTNKRIIADPEFEKNKEKFRGLLMEKVFKRQFKTWLDQKREEANILLN